ncbi:MAG: class I SAM-dependent methyltransferase [Jatrophihabitans sp.]
MTIQQNIAANYVEIADAYDGPWANFLFEHGRALADSVPLAAASRIVELGCGPGRLSGYLAGRLPEAEVVGVDLTPEMLARAPSGVRRVCGDGESIPLRTSCVDALLAPFVLFHLPDLARGLHESRRVLRPDGLFAAITWSTPNPHPAYEVWMQAVEASGAPADPSPQMPSGVVTADPILLGDAVTEAGFDAVEVARHPYAWQVDAEHFLRHSAVIGSAARRLRLLPAADRRAALDLAAHRLADLPPDAFIESGQLLYTVARRR